MEDSDNYDVFGAKDRAEFLFKVFAHITLGGPVNQVIPGSHLVSQTCTDQCVCVCVCVHDSTKMR